MATASAANRFGINFVQLNGTWTPPVPISTPFAPDSSISRAGGDYMTVFSAPAGFLPGGGTFMAAWAQFSVLTETPIRVLP